MRGSPTNDTFWQFLWNYISPNDSRQELTPNTSRARRTPKKIYKLSENGISCSWLNAIQLSMWDNISGPRIEQVWLGSATSIRDDIQIYTARHTLCGVLGQVEPDAQTETKFHLNAEQGYAITSKIFSAVCLGSLCKFSLSIITKRSHLQKYLVLHSIIEDRMGSLVAKLKVMLEKVPEGGMVKFTHELGRFCNDIEVLFASGITHVNLLNTFFFHDPLDQEFLSRAITSHIQTQGNTVVTGPDEDSVNMFIESLAIFYTLKERQKASFAVPSRPYTPDLIIQGIVGLDVALPENRVLESRTPTTWIDLEQHQVKQTNPFHEYCFLRREFGMVEIDRMLGTLSVSDKNLAGVRDGLFRTIKTASTFVTQLLMDIYRLPHAFREGYVAQFTNTLKRRAVVLMKYVESELSQHSRITEDFVKRLRFDLGLNLEADFTLMLAVAEKLQPGMYQVLAGDGTTIEAKFIEMFESF